MYKTTVKVPGFLSGTQKTNTKNYGVSTPSLKTAKLPSEKTAAPSGGVSPEA